MACSLRFIKCYFLKLVTTTFFCCFAITLFGNNGDENVAKLREIWNSNLSKSIKLQQLFETIESTSLSGMSQQTADSLIAYGMHTSKLAEELQNPRIEAMTLTKLAKVNYYVKEIYRASMEYLDDALLLLDEEVYPSEKAEVFETQGNLYRRIESYLKAIIAFEEAKRIREKNPEISKDPFQLGTTYYNEALAYKNVENLVEAKKHLLQSLHYARQADDRIGLVLGFSVLTTVMREQDSIKAAYAFLDSTYSYLSDKSGKDKPFYADALVIEGTLALQEEKFEKVIELNLEALKIYETTPDSLHYSAKAYHNIGEAYLQMKAYKAAQESYEKGLGYIEGSENFELLMRMNEGLSEAFFQQGKFAEARFCQLAGQEAHQEIYNKSLISSAVDDHHRIKQKYEQEKQELASKNQLILQGQKMKANLLSMGIGGLSIISLLSLFSLRSHRLKKNALERKNEAMQENLEQRNYIHSQSIIELLKDQELNLNSAYIEGQDEERQRISSELHDGVAGTLAASKMLIELYQNKLRKGKLEEAKELEEELVGMLDSAYKEVKDLSNDLDIAASHSTFGEIATQLLDQTKRLENLGIDADVQIAGAEHTQIKGSVGFHLRRITGESLTNIIKSANAQRVQLRLALGADHLSLLIEDDGKGFNLETVKKGKGLDNLHRRALKIGGKLTLDSQPGNGTRIALKINNPDLYLA